MPYAHVLIKNTATSRRAFWSLWIGATNIFLEE